MVASPQRGIQHRPDERQDEQSQWCIEHNQNSIQCLQQFAHRGLRITSRRMVFGLVYSGLAHPSTRAIVQIAHTTCFASWQRESACRKWVAFHHDRRRINDVAGAHDQRQVGSRKLGIDLRQIEQQVGVRIGLANSTCM